MSTPPPHSSQEENTPQQKKWLGGGIIQKHRRLLIKISGELLGGNTTKDSPNLCQKRIHSLCQQILSLKDKEIVLVPGGGNFFRGSMCPWMPCGTADNIGMLSTAMNGLAISSVLQELGASVHLVSARGIDGIAPAFCVEKALHALKKGKIVVCLAGVGIGAVTTDTAAVVRACELDCDLILKATHLDGLYEEDPAKNPHASFCAFATHQNVWEKKLEIMDLTAITLAWKAKKNILIFSMEQDNAMKKLLEGQLPCSYISSDTPLS